MATLTPHLWRLFVFCFEIIKTVFFIDGHICPSEKSEKTEEVGGYVVQLFQSEGRRSRFAHSCNFEE
jgi:hypothetical protein